MPKDYDLVRTEEGYFVPRKYLYYDDTDEARSEDMIEHVNATPPYYEYDEDYKKWALNFAGADFGGYDAQQFMFYFDSEEELLKFLQRDTSVVGI